MQRELVSSDFDKWQNMTTELKSFSFKNSSDGRKTAQMWNQAEACLKYWLKKGDLDVCLKILDHLAEAGELKQKKLHTEHILNPIVKLWRTMLPVESGEAKSSSLVPVPSEMSELLKRYEADGLCSMDKATHAMILDAASQMKDPEQGVLFAHDYLSSWIQRCQLNQDDNVKPDAVAIGSVIHAWVESDLPEAPERAEEWMNVCTDFLKLEPTTRLYTMPIAAWAKLGNANRANQWMDRLQSSKNIKADLAAWNNLLIAYARATENSSSDRSKQSPAHQAEKILQKMIHLYHSSELEDPPDVVSYSIVLDAWSKQTSRERRPKQRNDLQNEHYNSCSK